MEIFTGAIPKPGSSSAVHFQSLALVYMEVHGGDSNTSIKYQYISPDLPPIVLVNAQHVSIASLF